jgi:hypothetical protein
MSALEQLVFTSDPYEIKQNEILSSKYTQIIYFKGFADFVFLFLLINNNCLIFAPFVKN